MEQRRIWCSKVLHTRTSDAKTEQRTKERATDKLQAISTQLVILLVSSSTTTYLYSRSIY